MQKAKTGRPDFDYEQKLWRQGYDFVVGLDEVGRGPLAGPVVAGAVCVKKEVVIARDPAFAGDRGDPVAYGKNTGLLRRREYAPSRNDTIRDSKKLSANQRDQWYKFLTRHPDIKWGIGVVSEKVIDKINILAATKLAMRRAIEQLDIEPDFLLLDGRFLLEDLSISQKAVVRGDEQIWSCAAASIVAKVTRDQLMLKYHQKYPAYGFDRHKGYGTRRHMTAIKKYGACPIHRMSFKPVKDF